MNSLVTVTDHVASDDETLFVVIEDDEHPNGRVAGEASEQGTSLTRDDVTSPQAEGAPDADRVADALPRAPRIGKGLPASAQSLVRAGRDLVEVGLVHFDGQDTIERLRAKRSLLLYTYLGGCALCVAMVVLAMFTSLGRTARILPATSSIAQIDTADFNEMTITAQAFSLLTHMHTWSKGSIDGAEHYLQPFLDPSIRAKVAASFAEWKATTMRDRLYRTVRFIGSEYHGRLTDDSFEILVGYEINESVHKKAEFHRSEPYFAAMQFVPAVPTKDNPRGIVLKRIWEVSEKDFNETDRARWKRWQHDDQD